jgi:drug/metabolite transporter (DMT)-like permease
MLGVLLGLTSALCWGVTDALAAVFSRRLGTLRTAAYSLLVSVLVLGLATIATEAWRMLDIFYLLRVGAVGVIAAIANLALWQALRLGPVSVVSPVSATVGAATVVLAVLLLGERPDPVQLLAVPVAATGTMLASIVPHATTRRPSLIGGGVVLAVVAVIGYALVGVTLRDPIREVGWLPAAFVSRATNTALMWVFLLVVVGHSRSAPARVPVPAWSGVRQAAVVPALLILGLADVGGLVAFSVGLETSPAWLIGLLASTGPVIGIAVGLTHFGERLRRTQWLGIGLVGIALVLVALGELPAG